MDLQTHPAVLILAPPGNYRTSLVALLTTLMDVRNIHTSEDLLSIIEENKIGSMDFVLLGQEYQPGSKLSEKIRQTFPRARVVMLTNSGGSVNVISRRDVDYCLPRGASVGELLELFSSLLAKEKPLSENRAERGHASTVQPNVFPG